MPAMTSRWAADRRRMDERRAQHQPVKVLYTITSLGGGGAERQLYLLLSRLDRTRFRPIVVTYHDGVWRHPIEGLPVPVVVVDYKRGRARALLRTIEVIRRLRPTIVHAIGMTANALGGLSAILARHPPLSGRRRPFLIVSERNEPVRLGRGHVARQRALGRLAQRIITNSHHAATFYRDHRIVPARKITVVQNGIEVAGYEISRGSSSGASLAYVASFHEQKNHELLIRALVHLKERFPSLVVHLVGDGERRRAIEEMVVEQGLTDHVAFHGFRKDVPQLLAQLDAYVHVAAYEGISNAVMEAMACALPCITLDIPGNRELIQNGDTGIMVPNDPAALVNALISVLSNPAHAREIGSMARESLSRSFSVERMVARTESAYDSVLRSGR